MKIAILGGGLTGLCAALRLKEASLPATPEVIVLEERPLPGGLLQSTYQSDYWWDNGVFFFNQSNYLCQLLPDLFQPVADQATKAWLKDGIYNFPLLKQSKLSLLRGAFDYVYSYIRCTLGWDGVNLHDWLRYRLTARLLKLSGLETYLTKLQGLPPSELSPRIGELRLPMVHEMTRPGRTLLAFFATQRKIKEMKMKRDPVVYPFGAGVGEISGRLTELCRAKGVRIISGAKVTELIREDGAVLEIHYDGPNGPEVYRANFGISTIPLEEVALACKPGLSAKSLASARQLEYMDLKLFFFIVNRPLIFHQFFILYSLENYHPWKRLLCMALPNGLNAVTVEVTFNHHTGQVAENLEDIIIKQLSEELRLFEPGEIMVRQSAVVHRAYPVYRLGFEEKVKTVMDEVESARLRLAGRQGRFLYVSTPGAIKSAIEAADEIIQSIATMG